MSIIPDGHGIQTETECLPEIASRKDGIEKLFWAGMLQPMSDVEKQEVEAQEIWVNTNEAAEITGYFYTHVRKLARDNWNLPEDQRVIRVRRRIERYEIWLPDLIKYMNGIGKGPHSKDKNE